MTTQNWFADAPPLPFVPFKGVTKEELCVLFTGYRPLTNRRRNRPPIALAIFGFFSSAGALLATSPGAEHTLASWVPAVKETVTDVTMSGGLSHQAGLDR